MKTSDEDSKPKFDLSVRWLLVLLTWAVGFTVLFAVLEMAEGPRAVGLAAFAATAVGSALELARQAVIAVMRFSIELSKLKGTPTCDIRLCIVSQAETAGVQGVYTRFTPSREGETEIRAALKEQLERGTGQLRVFGVAAKCLFHDLAARSLFDEHMPQSAVVIKAIMLDRKCAWADVRDGLEGGHLTRDDIRTTFDYLHRLRNQWGASRVQYLATDIPVPAFVVMTDEWAFVEAYPIAEVTGPLGGRTPLLKLGADSSGYKIWSETFELLWKYPQLETLKQHVKTLAP